MRGLEAYLLSCAVSATGCFGFWPREPTLANLNKEGIYWHGIRKFTEPKTAEIQVSERAGSELPSELSSKNPKASVSGCPPRPAPRD